MAAVTICSDFGAKKKKKDNICPKVGKNNGAVDTLWASSVTLVVKNPLSSISGWEDTLEEGMACYNCKRNF